MSEDIIWILQKALVNIIILEVPKITVFIIDDEKDILKLYSLHFELNGLKVVGTATNGNEAIEKIKNSNPKPDIILIDYHMPIINGIETSKLILKLDRSYKIIMISGDPSVKEIALTNGITDFFVKPQNIKSLCQRIRMVAERN